MHAVRQPKARGNDARSISPECLAPEGTRIVTAEHARGTGLHALYTGEHADLHHDARVRHHTARENDARCVSSGSPTPEGTRIVTEKHAHGTRLHALVPGSHAGGLFGPSHVVPAQASGGQRSGALHLLRQNASPRPQGFRRVLLAEDRGLKRNASAPASAA
jgi:hypothetical protein